MLAWLMNLDFAGGAAVVVSPDPALATDYDLVEHYINRMRLVSDEVILVDKDEDEIMVLGLPRTKTERYE